MWIKLLAGIRIDNKDIEANGIPIEVDHILATHLINLKLAAAIEDSTQYVEMQHAVDTDDGFNEEFEDEHVFNKPIPPPNDYDPDEEVKDCPIEISRNAERGAINIF